MGLHINPGNKSFYSDSHGEIYIDKTGLLEELNRMINTPQRYVAVSRARRFGKSMAAGMIDAYYSIGCDSKEMFKPYEISKADDFETHLNRYNVIHFDLSEFTSPLEDINTTVDRLDDMLLAEMREAFPNYVSEGCQGGPKAAWQVYQATGRQFIVVIDEWDCLIRDYKDNEELILSYLRYLRGFFKTEESKQFLALGYLTGILPIKKLKGESAMNNFVEYTMVSTDTLTQYYGFTQDEVEKLCRERHGNIEVLREWYDGYLMRTPPDELMGKPRSFHVYNPNSIALYFWKRVPDSYWKNTGAFQSLNDYIARNEDGLKDTVIRLLAGERCVVKIGSFQNDLTSYRNKDDVLTALIHMGYLGYDAGTREAFIPNEEVREVFTSAIEVGDWSDIQGALNLSDELMQATWSCDESRVAELIARSHEDMDSTISYNDENSLACVVMLAYYTAHRYYMMVREFPTGKGVADIAFIPRNRSNKPAMIVELKWNKDAETAIRQIHEKRYSGRLADHYGNLLLVGINYDKSNKEYSCIIEKG